MSASHRTIEVPPYYFRAAISANTDSDRTADLIFSTGAAVDRVDARGQRYVETLSLAPGNVRLDRLNSGAPLLDSHQAGTVEDILGAVVPGSARVDHGRGLATVKFSARKAVAPILQDVRDKIIRSVSVGYRVHKFVETTPDPTKSPIRTATDWEPFEISLVTMPADPHAHVRRQDPATNRCVIVPALSGREDEDQDRLRRLRLARAIAQELPPERGAIRQPTAAHLKAVGDALEKFLGRGRWGYLQGHTLPEEFAGFRWDHPFMDRETSPGRVAGGVTSFYKDGRIVIDLRSDMTPARVHQTALHELQHVHDHLRIKGGEPKDRYEWRARTTAERLGSIP